MAALGKPYANISFEMQRNDTYQETWRISELDAAGIATPMNLTGKVLEMDICRVAGDGAPVVELDEEAVSTISGIKVADQGTNPGEFLVTLLGSSFGAVGSSQEQLKLAIDLKITFGTGLAFVYGRGIVTVTPGVSL